MRHTVIAGLLLLSSVACVPIPHLERDSPPVAGHLVRGDSPAPGVEIRLSVGETDDQCTTFWRETSTDRQGDFAFPVKKRFAPFMLLAMAHTFYPWSVGVREDTEFARVISANEYALAGVPGAGPRTKVILTCDLGALAEAPVECAEPDHYRERPADCPCRVERVVPQNTLAAHQVDEADVE